MAETVSNQLWVTSVVTAEDIPKALTLYFSLKEVLTTRKVGVIVSPKLHRNLKEVLYRAFDCIFFLEADLNTAKLKDEEYVKLFPLTLKSFEKVVYLSSTMLVIRNADEIFTVNFETQALVCAGDDAISMIAVQPSFQVFQTLQEFLGTKNGSTFEDCLKKWLKNQSNGVCNDFHENFNEIIPSESGYFSGNENTTSIINLKNLSLEANTERFGFFTKLIVEYWRKIYIDNVKPLLGSVGSSVGSQISEKPSHQRCFNSEPIAIVGMSCRYPSANNLEEFWSLLINGKDATGTPPDYRWTRENSLRHCDEYRNTNAGFLKYPIEEFDAKFFGISPKEMLFLDPQHRLLHELVWEGLEDAAIDPNSLNGTNGGVFIGSWLNEFKDILNFAGDSEFYRMYMGTGIGSGAARISHLLGLTGPCIATESGCSSAMVAVHLACKSLQRGETNLGLACGVNLLLHPFDKDIMPMVVSPDGHSKTFDASANGYGRAEGCGILVLKRYSDAIKNGDKICALIKGSAMTQEGISKSMGTPTIHCESLAMTQALQDARVDPALVSYVEAHGTGTIVGDPLEVAAIAKAYHSKRREEPLYIGSVKTNVGHTESCSGITGIIKVVLAMQHETIPPHINFETLNPSINLDAVPAIIPVQPVSWQKQEGKPRFAGISSFGVTGTDAHVIVEEPPALSTKLLSNSCSFEKPLHIMKISTKNEEALDILIENIEKHFSTTREEFKNLSYTANIGRADFGQRAVLIAKSNEDAIQKLKTKTFLRGGESTEENQGKICFLFTGQGSQFPGMAKQLYETSPVFRIHFEHCDTILKTMYNINITSVMWSENNLSEVSRTIYSQTSIFCVEYALLKLWESWGVKPDYVLGHSLGEFAAAVCAGFLSVEDAIKLVAERSRLIDSLPQGKMLVIKGDAQRVDSYLKKFAKTDANKYLDCAAINSNEQTVLAGESDAILEFAQCCKEENLKCMVLEATHAFHSRHMDPILDEYRKVAKSIKKLNGNAKCSYISGMKGHCIIPEEMDSEYWVEHTREKVMFLNASKKGVELGCKTFIEIGPQPILSALTQINNDGNLSCFPSLKRNENEWETLLNTLGKLYIKGLNINWKGVDQFYNRNKVQVPHYPFIRTRYWPDMMAKTDGVLLHPLLGSCLPNASSTKLFQSNLSLNSLEYLKDHAIGDIFVFPGAAYVEICLAAGLATIGGSTEFLPPPTRAMKLENVIIEAPLALQENSSSQLQTVAEPNVSQTSGGDWNDITIKIFQRMFAESPKWQPHARAIFCPVPTPQEKDVNFDSDSFFRTLQNPPEDEDFVELVYDKLASVGLKFGPIFKSIERIWKDDKNKTLVAKVKMPLQLDKYIIHPVIIDAMIQAVKMLTPINQIRRSLFVPIKIGKFLWVSEMEKGSNSECYIHAYEEKDGGSSAMLVSKSGQVLAVMTHVELIDTTVKAIESVLEQQVSSMPDCWEEVWRKTPSILDHSVDMERAKGKYYTDEFHKEYDTKYNKPSEFLSETFQNMETLVYLNMLRAIYEMGWKPEKGQTFSESALFRQLGVIPEYRKYFAFICEVLQAEGILRSNIANSRESNWTVIQKPPTYKHATAMLNTPALSRDLVDRFEPVLLLQVVGENLSGLLKGSKSAISVLFPEGEKKYPSISNFYDQYGELIKATQGEQVIDLVFRHIVSSQSNPNTVLRILEVGAGTGACTEKVIKILESTGTQFEYTYTDISAAFFPAAEKRFEKYLNSMKFKKLNIENDSVSQGFTPNYFDIVIAAEVIHATKHIGESLRNLYMLMKPWARLSIHETTKINRVHAFSFGTLEGYWRFQDVELRQKYCVMEKQVWTQVLAKAGFEVDGIFSVFNNDHSYFSALKINPPSVIPIEEETNNNKLWMIFHQPDHFISNYLLEKIQLVPGRRIITVSKEEKFQEDERHGSFAIRGCKYDDFVALLSKLTTCQEAYIEGIIYCWALDETATTQEELLQPYFNLTKSLLTLDNVNPRLVLITKGVVPLHDNSNSGSFHASTLWGYTKSMKNENFHFNCKCIDVSDEKMDRMENIFFELWNTCKEAQVAFSGNCRYVPKFQRHRPVEDSLKLPSGTERYHLLLPETKAISDLQFGPVDEKNMEDDQVEIQIKVSALNFRDVLSIIKPSDDFKNSSTVGLDFAGVVKRVGKRVSKWNVGDRVYGCNVHFDAMPSYIILPEDFMLQLPPNLSYAEGATIPAVHMTSIMCLINIAKIKKEDVVLIHCASGGVGLSAIAICKEIGCQVVVTAGSKRKQRYLKSLGIQNIYNSRSTEFGDQILELTNGRGVDVVLNSLTSEGFKEATLKACAKGARFVEMSKLNIWMEADVRSLRPDVKYTTIDLTQLSKPEWIRLLHSLESPLGQKVVKPIPYVRFDAVNIRQALEYMQKAKHIGKIVCTFPELLNENGEMRIHTPMFNQQSSYLITGGLGGIGFLVAQWMVSKGARHVVLAGRSQPSSSTQAKINAMNSQGANVIWVKLNVGNFSECQELLEKVFPERGLPPLKGVMHAAGTLSDGLIINQEWSNLRTTFDTKINGSLNLHQLTRDLKLDHFVLFSSIVALFGTSGQCNHAAANCFEDSLAHYRNSIGLPATTINWGQWGEVGVAKEIDLSGLKVLSNLQGIAGLEYVMRTHRLQTSIFNVESFVLLSKVIPQLVHYLDESLWKESSSTSCNVFKSDEFWQQFDSMHTEEEKVALMNKFVLIILKNVLKLNDSENIDGGANLQEMGVDSLMFVEIKNVIQSLMGDRLIINVSSIKDCNTVNLLAGTLVKLIEGKGENIKPTFEQVQQLIREDCHLPENICSKEGQSVEEVGEIKTVLLTGSTGSLGPYILKQIADLDQISQVICLLRPHHKETLDERLKKVLDTKGLTVNMSKVRCVAGNVADYHLGLEQNIWDELSATVDAIIHCAVSVQHTEHYLKRDSKTDSRAVNIGGTKNVLEFACENRLKHVYHASSVAAVVTVDEDDDGRLSERWPEEGEFDGIMTLAYPITKYVGDMLMKQGAERGIPCKVFRLPYIMGESNNGRCSIKNNHVLLRYMFMMKNGIMPSTPVPMIMLPVDVCADVSVRLFFNEQAGTGIYNIHPASPGVDQEFVEIAKKFGYDVNIVDLGQFAERVQEPGSALEMFKDFYSDDKGIIGIFAGAPVLQKWVQEGCQTNGLWYSKKVAKFIPDFFEKQKTTSEYIYQDLLFCKNQGWFEKFGL